MPLPWDTGDLKRNWQGYFIPGTSILRNRVGARILDELRDAENDLVEFRVIELREAPDLLGDRTYDLAYLRSIHRQLFQDVYDWAGDLRTVGIEKGNESFCPPGSIGQPMDHMENGQVWVCAAAWFAGAGTIGGQTVRCLTPQGQVLCRTGYPLHSMTTTAGTWPLFGSALASTSCPTSTEPSATSATLPRLARGKRVPAI